MLNTNGHAAFALQFHLVFVTKYRHPCLTHPMLIRLEAILTKVCKNWRCALLACNGEADHVHLLVSGHPAVNLSRLVGNLKTVSARGLRKEFASALKPYYWRPVLWSASYAAFTVGAADLETVTRYIRNQESPLAESPALPTTRR